MEMNVQGTTTGRIPASTETESNKPKPDTIMLDANTQTGSGWTGILVLRGTFDISPLYKPALEQQGNYHLVYGDSKNGTMDFREVTENTPRQDAVAHVAQKMPIAPFSMLLCGDYPKTMHVPTRNTTVALWNQGHCSPGFTRMIEQLIQLNREPVDDKTNYAKLIRERVFDHQLGKYSVCLAYFSRHPRVVLGTRNMELYCWIVSYNGVHVFLWSTDSNYMERVRQHLEPTKQNELFYLEVQLNRKSLLVVHPLYWVTKFNKMFAQTRGQSNVKINLASYFRNYLLRMSLTDTEYYQPEVNNEQDGETQTQNQDHTGG